MKGPLLALIAVGLPLGLMLVISGNRKEGASTGSPPTAVAEAKPTRARAHPPRLARGIPLQALSSQPAIADLIDAAADWIGDVSADAASEKARAGRFLAVRDYPRAVKAFDRLLLQHPNDASLLLGKGMALVGVDRYDDALVLFHSAIEHDPGNAPARFNLGVSLARTGHAEAAIAAFRELLQRHPGHVRGRFNLATLLQAMGQYQEALQLWRELTDSPAPSTRPGDPGQLLQGHLMQSWSHRGECASRLGLFNEAEAGFQQITRLDPADPRGWLNLGIAQAGTGNRRSAAESLQKALELSPKLVPALNQLAYIEASWYREIGDPEIKARVLELCRRSLAIAPEQGNIRQLRYALQHEEDAEEEQESAEGEKPQQELQ